MQQASRRPKNLAIAGAIILVVSIAVLVSFADELEATTDPSLNSVIALEGGESGQINLSKDSSYLLFRLSNAEHNCTITEVATQTEVTIGEPGWFESDRPGEGGELYYVVGSFIPDENGPHIIENSAEEGNNDDAVSPEQTSLVDNNQDEEDVDDNAVSPEAVELEDLGKKLSV